MRRTAVQPHASPGTAPTIPGSASRCARTATTTPPTSCGTTRQGNCGGAPSKPSNAASASSPAAAACPRSGSPAATATTAWSTRSASPTARPPNTRPAERSTSTPCSASTATTPRPRHACCPRPPSSPSPTSDAAIRWAAQAISYRTPPHPARPGGWTITWGTEIDIRVITLTGTGNVTDLAVASYLAKYSTKGTEPTGHASARITADTIDLYANPDGTHPERLIAACWSIGADRGYTGLRRWAHMLGFGGHFLTKARRYSIPSATSRGPHHLPARPGHRTRTRTHPHRRPCRRRKPS